ncbi:MAG: acyl-CoA/acyl-ACP dehydrogenase, partial [Chloroflexi bacterium]|nr:acyl-CoA/acyl-ACP dehydrogenase [Chloroflexota bacterium]
MELSEDQKMLRTTAREFLDKECTKQFVREMEQDKKGYSPALWQKMMQLGWQGLPFPETCGGGGGSYLDLVVLIQEMGRACLPGPFLSTVVLGGMPILTAGSEEQKREFLAAIARGKILTLALTEPDGSYDPASIQVKAPVHGDEFVITGTKSFVPDAHVADYLLCAARTRAGSSGSDGISLFIVDSASPGITTTALNTIANDRQCEVRFDKVMVPETRLLGGLHQGWGVIEKALQYASVAMCAEMVGGGEKV